MKYKINNMRFFPLLLILAFFSCQNTDTQSNQTEETTDNQIEPRNDKKGEELVIDESNKYDKKFIELLGKTSLGKTVEIKNDQLYFENKPYDFPNVPEIGKKVKLLGSKKTKQGKNIEFELVVEKLRPTNLDFIFRAKVDGKEIEVMEGLAILNPFFMIGAEIDEDQKTGLSYPADKYTYLSTRCVFDIRISGEDGQIRAKVRQNCKDKYPDITLEDSPTLYAVD